MEHNLGSISEDEASSTSLAVSMPIKINRRQSLSPSPSWSAITKSDGMIGPLKQEMEKHMAISADRDAITPILPSARKTQCNGTGVCFQLSSSGVYSRGNCPHFCGLQPCSHPLCAQRLPKWMLKVGDGYCPDCAVIGTIVFHNDMIRFHAMYKNTDYCQDCYAFLQGSQPHTCHRQHRARHDDFINITFTPSPSSLTSIPFTNSESFSSIEDDDDSEPAV